MLESLRAYAQEQLEPQDREALETAHARYYLRLVEEADQHLRGPDPMPWKNRLGREQENVRAAFLRTADVNFRLRIIGVFWRYWYMTSAFAEGRAWLQRAMEGGERAEEAILAKALNGAGLLTLRLGDHAEARALLEASLRISRARQDKLAIAETVSHLGSLVIDQGDSAQARLHFEEALEIFRSLNDTWRMATALSNMGRVAMHGGDLVAAQEYYLESAAIFRDYRAASNLALILINLGAVSGQRQQYDLARSALEECLPLFRAQGNRYIVAIALSNLGDTIYQQGDLIAARPVLQESLLLWQELGGSANVAEPLSGLGNIARGLGDYVRAARLLSAADTVRERTGIPWNPLQQADMMRNMEATRLAMEKEEFDATQRWGKSATLAQVIEYALESTSEPKITLEKG